METALREHPDIVKKYFGTIIPTYDTTSSSFPLPFFSSLFRVTCRAG